MAVLAAGARAFPLFVKAYYTLPVLLAYFIVLGYKEIKLNKRLRIIVILLLLFSVWCLITSIWSAYPFITITRSLYFALISVGSVIGSYLYIKAKNKFDINFLFPLNIFLVLLSLISLIFKIPGDAWSGGNGMGFMGFASHQNTLGALILFTIPAPIFFIHQMLKKWKETKLLTSDFYLLASSYFLLIFNFSFLILSHSRASILSFLVMAGIMIYNIINLKIFIILTSVFCLLTSAIYLFPATHKAAHEFFFKNETFFGDHRYFMYEDSFKAALDGGLIGLGYGISDPNIHNAANGSHYESMPNWMLRMGNVISTTEGRRNLPSDASTNSVISTTEGRRNPQSDESTHSVISTTKGRRNPTNGIYIREKGNSVLATVEETGIIGLVLFLLPIGYLFKKLAERIKENKANIKPELGLLLAIITAFLFHGQFEAWWTGVGSIDLPLFMVLTFQPLFLR